MDPSDPSKEEKTHSITLSGSVLFFFKKNKSDFILNILWRVYESQD